MIRPAALTRTDLPSKPKSKTNSEARRLKPRGNLAVFVCVIARTGAFINRSGGQKPLRKTPVPPFEAL